MSFESDLKKNMLSDEEKRMSQEAENLSMLTQLANTEVKNFKLACEDSAQNLEHNCHLFTFTWIDHGTTPNDFHGNDNLFVGIENGGSINIKGKISKQDTDLFLDLLKDALKAADFQNATIHKHPIYLTRTSIKRTRGLFSTKVKSAQIKELVAEKFCISTSW